MKKFHLAAILATGLAGLGLTTSASAQSFVGLNSGGTSLSLFGPSGVVTTTSSISGLSLGDTLVDLDYFLSSNGSLYGMGTSGTLYTLAINGTSTTAAISAGPTYNTGPASIGTPTAMDFNPAANRLRVFSGTQNFRVTPGTSVSTGDGTLAYQAGDVRAGQTPTLRAAAYTNNVPAPSSTALYSIDTGFDSLVLHLGAPQFSTLSTVASLTLGGTPVDFGADTGFDILTVGGVNTAYLSNGNTMYTVDLANGALTPFATVTGASGGITSIAAVPEPTTVALLAMVGLGFLVWRLRRPATARA